MTTTAAHRNRRGVDVEPAWLPSRADRTLLRAPVGLASRSCCCRSSNAIGVWARDRPADHAEVARARRAGRATAGDRPGLPRRALVPAASSCCRGRSSWSASRSFRSSTRQRRVHELLDRPPARRRARRSKAIKAQLARQPRERQVVHDGARRATRTANLVLLLIDARHGQAATSGRRTGSSRSRRLVKVDDRHDHRRRRATRSSRATRSPGSTQH